MQEERFLDTVCDEWLEGYEWAQSMMHQPVYYNLVHLEYLDELYCLESGSGIWYMIDTTTAVEWGL